MNTSELGRHLRVRHRRAIEVQRRFDACNARLRDGDRYQVITESCDKHSRGRHPALAKVYVVEEGLLFVSRIRWWAQDRVRIQPWRVDALMSRAALDIDLADEGAVEGFAKMLGELRQPEASTPNDRYWLRGEPDHYIHDVLDLPPDPADGWLPDLWARCVDHPAGARKLDRERLVAIARRSTSVPRRYPPATVRNRQG